jgi:cell division protease FtsH
LLLTKDILVPDLWIGSTATTVFMEEQPKRSGPKIPVWVWIVGGVILILGVQFWLTSRSNQTAVIGLSEAAAQIESGSVKEIVVSGSRIRLLLKDGTVLTTVMDDSGGLDETLAYFGVTLAVLEEHGTELIVNDRSGANNLVSIALTLGPLLLLIWVFSRGFRRAQGGDGNNIFGFGRSRAKSISDADRPTVTFDDVAGAEEAKYELAEVANFLREPERFIQVGARIPKGVLMVGLPGTGKTLLARAVAGEAGVPFFHISGSEFVEMFVGVGASRVRDLFEKAKKAAPSIVFVDEIDAVGRQRGTGLGGGSDEREQTLNQILVEMDGFDNETNVIVMAATNRADILDPALMRPGRFDRKVYVDLPDVKGREAILGVHVRGKPVGADVSLADIARLTAGFAGADLENLINEAAILAARRDKRVIGLPEFQDAFDRVVMGPERKSRVLSEEDKELVAYHEAGHAVVSFFLVNTDPVQKITIVPRGRAGGYVMPLPQDRFVHSLDYFDDQIAMALGGRASEEVFFGRITTGASSDLQQATRLARAMVTQYGMSEKLGLPTYGDQADDPFLGRYLGYGAGGREYSEDAATAIDQEVRRILRQNYQRALDIVKEHKDSLVAVAKSLVKVETLDREAFERLIDGSAQPAATPLRTA